MDTKKVERAIALLQSVLLDDAPSDNEFDRPIYEFLREVGGLPEAYVPAWERDDEKEVVV
jgi:hypothetical protein